MLCGEPLEYSSSTSPSILSVIEIFCVLVSLVHVDVPRAGLGIY